MSVYVDWSRLNPPITPEEKDESAFNVGVVMLMTGVPRLDTVADMHELLFRVRFYTRLHGAIIMNSEGTDLSSTLTFWNRWRGVRVNGNKETRKAWMRRITDNVASDIEYKLRNEL